jgi:hypothetical protein
MTRGESRLGRESKRLYSDFILGNLKVNNISEVAASPGPACWQKPTLSLQDASRAEMGLTA